MAKIALSGSDTIVINDRPLTDLADADCAMLAFPNDIANVKVGKNGNAIYGLNENGKVCEVTLRALRGSADDKFLLNLLVLQQANFAATVLMTGQFVKQIGNGAGAVAADTYIMAGGVFMREVDAKSNVEGDTEQSVSIYKMKFSQAVRVIT